MQEWFKLSEDDRKIIINQVSSKTGLLKYLDITRPLLIIS